MTGANFGELGLLSGVRKTDAGSRYYIRMKTPPDTPEFARFSNAAREILKVSKSELDQRIAEDRTRRNPAKLSSSRDSASASKGH
jgi:hypothetical protein